MWTVHPPGAAVRKFGSPQPVSTSRTRRNVTQVSENSQWIRTGNVMKWKQQRTEMGTLSFNVDIFHLFDEQCGIFFILFYFFYFILYFNDVAWRKRRLWARVWRACETAKCCWLMLAQPQRQYLGFKETSFRWICPSLLKTMKLPCSCLLVLKE